MLAAEEADAPLTSAATGLPVVAPAVVPQPQHAVAASSASPVAVVPPTELPAAATVAASDAPATSALPPVGAAVEAPLTVPTAPPIAADPPLAAAPADSVEDAAPSQHDDASSCDPSDAHGAPNGSLLGRLKIQETARNLAEHERVQQGVEFAKQKANQLYELERVQKGLEVAHNLKTSAAATAAVASLVAQEGMNVAKEKAKEGMEIAKEKTQKLREGASGVWNKGRGTISRVRANVSKVAWRGSARETLDVAAREEHWQNIKVQGAEEMTIPARTEHTTAYHVSKGSTLRWTFRVKDYDIGFGVRMRVQEWGGSREEEVLAVERYDNADTISGSWVADENRTIVLVFDNRYSRLRGKTVAYVVGTEKPSELSSAPAANPAAPPAAPAAPADSLAAAASLGGPAAAAVAVPAAGPAAAPVAGYAAAAPAAGYVAAAPVAPIVAADAPIAAPAQEVVSAAASAGAAPAAEPRRAIV